MSSILEGPAHQGRGVVLSAQGTPLQRLNYFDGKFLRADHLREEQDYLRTLVGFANRASGVGIVHGFDVEQGGGDTLVVRPGLATDASGSTLLLQGSEHVSMTDLILASQGAATPSSDWGAPGATSDPFSECADEVVVTGGDALDDLYIVTAHPSDRLCGTEDVYGLLCEQACYTDTQHPYIRSGVLLRARPLRLDTALMISTSVDVEDDRFWRSRVASAFYAGERGDPASLISAAGLAGSVWCRGAAARVGEGIPLAVVGRRGSANVFLDLWTVRRERMEASPQRYWASRMAMRPWDVFLAQVLQFQCQLSSADLGVGDTGEKGCRDELRSASTLMSEMQAEVERLAALLAEAEGGADGGEVAALEERLREEGNREKLVAELSALMSRKVGQIRGNLGSWLANTPSRQRLLLDAGFVELPPAGYLPVTPGDVAVEEQVRDLMGEGVDLRFCVVRPDFVPHAFEEAQHMDRISLVQGLDDPQTKPRVDILVPRGQSVSRDAPRTGQGYDMTLALTRNWVLRLLRGAARIPSAYKKKLGMAMPSFVERLAGSVAFHGAGRSERLPGGGAAFHFSGLIGPRDGDALFARCTAGALGAEEGKLERLESVLRDVPRTRAGGVVIEEARVGEEMPEMTVVEEALRGAVWTSLRSDLDPFGLASGDATSMRSELDLLVVANGETLRRRAVFDGQYVVDSPAGGGDSVSGRLQGTLTVFGDEAETVQGSLLLRRTGAFGRTSMEFLMDGYSSVGGRGRRVWTGPDTALACGGLERAGMYRNDAAEEEAIDVVEEAEAVVEALGEVAEAWNPMLHRAMTVQPTMERGRVEPFFAADQRIDQDALQPGHTAYADAVEGLDLYRSRVDAALADARQRLLLPDPSGDGGSRTLAREDWVLFHRRRDKECGASPTEVRQVRQRYRVYRSDLSLKRLKALFRKVAAGDDTVLASIPWTSVGSVTFAPGERTPQNGAGDLLRNWSFQGLVGAKVAVAVVGSDDYAASGGKALAKDRLIKTVHRLGSVADTSATELEVLPGGVASLPVQGMDGVVLLVTVDGKEIPSEDTVVRVVVKSEKGDPVPGAKLRLRGCGPMSVVGRGEGARCTSARVLEQVAADSDGQAALRGLEPGFYEVSVDPASSGFTGAEAGGSVVFELRAGEGQDVGFVLTS